MPIPPPELARRHQALPDRLCKSCASSRHQALLGSDSFINNPPTATSSASRVAALRPGTTVSAVTAAAFAAAVATTRVAELACVADLVVAPEELEALRGRR